MKFIPTELEGVWLIEPVRHRDTRGYFCETFRRDLFEKATGLRPDFVQENESLSSQGVVRGLHYQAGSAAQAKLVRVSEGTIVDVASTSDDHRPPMADIYAWNFLPTTAATYLSPEDLPTASQYSPRWLGSNIRSTMSTALRPSAHCASTTKKST